MESCLGKVGTGSEGWRRLWRLQQLYRGEVLVSWNHGVGGASGKGKKWTNSDIIRSWIGETCWWKHVGEVNQKNTCLFPWADGWMVSHWLKWGSPEKARLGGKGGELFSSLGFQDTGLSCFSPSLPNSSLQVSSWFFFLYPQKCWHVVFLSTFFPHPEWFPSSPRFWCHQTNAFKLL